MLLAPLGPVGMIIGGMIGHIVADWVLTTFRNWQEVASVSSNPRGPPGGGGKFDPGYPGGGGGANSGTSVPNNGWTGPDQDQAAEAAGVYTESVWDQHQAPTNPVTEIKDELDALRLEFQSAQHSGDRARQIELFQAIREKDKQLRAAKYSAGRR